MTTSTHTTDRLEGRGAMRTTWKRLGAVGLSLAALAAAVTTSALADTAKQRVVGATDHTVLANKPVQQITGISCLSSAGGCDLHATTGTLTVPDGASYTIWGYGPAAGAASVPGPTIVANKGDSLTIHVTNDLTVPTSFSVAGVPVGDVAPASRNLQIAPASAADYTFTVNSSGTLTYEPGPDAPTGPRQVAMGMAGTLVIRPTSCAPISFGCAYGIDLPAAQSTLDIYNDEALVAINDLDSRMLTATDPLTFLMADYSPDIHLINGKAFPDTQVIDALAGDSVLVRYANLSPIDRTMGVLGGHQKIIGRDAHPLSHTDTAVAPLFTPGQTAEAIVQVSTNAQPGDRFAIADQSRRMPRINTGGLDKEIVGALTFIEVWKLAADANQPVVTDLALTGGTVPDTDDVADGSANLTFTFADSLGTTWRFFIDQIDLSGGNALAGQSGTVTTAMLTSIGNGPHVIWVQSSLDGTTWGDASGIAFFLDRSGPVVHDTYVEPVAVNGDANHSTVTISSTGDTSLTGTQNVNAGFYAINPNAAAINCLAVETGTVLDADPAGALPLAGLTQVQGFLSTADISAAGLNLPEGGYNVSVIARDSLGHFSSDPSNNPVCETANSGLDALNRPYSFVIDKHGPVVSGGVANNFADPATTNGYVGYVANPNFEDSVFVQVQLSDLPVANVNSNVAQVEGFLEGSAGYTDATTGVNTPYTFVAQGGGVFEPQGPGVTEVNVDGLGIEFTASDGAFDSATEKAYALVPLSTVQQLTAGAHRMFVHALDSAGNWGPDARLHRLGRRSRSDDHARSRCADHHRHERQPHTGHGQPHVGDARLHGGGVRHADDHEHGMGARRCRGSHARRRLDIAERIGEPAGCLSVLRQRDRQLHGQRHSLADGLDSGHRLQRRGSDPFDRTHGEPRHAASHAAQQWSPHRQRRGELGSNQHREHQPDRVGVDTGRGARQLHEHRRRRGQSPQRHAEREHAQHGEQHPSVHLLGAGHRLARHASCVEQDGAGCGDHDADEHEHPGHHKPHGARRGEREWHAGERDGIRVAGANGQHSSDHLHQRGGRKHHTRIGPRPHGELQHDDGAQNHEDLLDPSQRRQWHPRHPRPDPPGVLNMSAVSMSLAVRPERRLAKWLVAALAVAAMVAVFAGVRDLRSSNASVTHPSRAIGMPTSGAIESTYGVRFDRVVVVATGGMLQINYTVLDESKATALHDEATLPYLQLADGTKLNMPGIAGHAHSKSTPAVGSGGYILLANSNALVADGTEVSIHMGQLRLDHVPVAG